MEMYRIIIISLHQFFSPAKFLFPLGHFPIDGSMEMYKIIIMSLHRLFPPATFHSPASVPFPCVPATFELDLKIKIKTLKTKKF